MPATTTPTHPDPWVAKYLQTDRTVYVPAHTGPHVFLNSPFWYKLLCHARKNRFAIRDVNLSVKKTYGDLLADVLALRAHLEASLAPPVLQRIHRGEEVYIGVLSAGGYEFAVAILTVLALGAAVVPMSIVNPVDEAAYYVTKAGQDAIIASADASELARLVTAFVNKRGGSVQCFEVLPHLPATPLYTPEEMVVSSDRYLDENAPGIVIFTSGTTGKPKGVVLRRAFILDTALTLADGYEITADDVVLHVLPVHHVTGLGASFFTFLVTGACVEFRSGSFDAAWIWQRWRQGGITCFSGVPTIFMRLQWYFERNIANLPAAEREPFIHGANRLRSMFCGSSALQSHVQKFWTALRQGTPILVRYGSSEFLTGCLTPASIARDLPLGSVGTIVPGVEIKLSEGDHGELLIKSPHMFSKYLNDQQATIESHDENGWFKSGDICRRDNSVYFILGRASVDVIKSGGYKISASEIEREILELPYIAEALVIGVEDEEFGQRVSAVVTLEGAAAAAAGRVSIDGLRDTLRSKLPGYKLPTILRIVDGELEKGPTGKVQKKILGAKLFPVPGWQNHPDIQVWRRKPKPAIAAML